MTNMNATIYEKHGKYQISISWTVNGKRFRKSKATGLPVKGNKRKAQAMADAFMAEMESKVSDGYTDMLFSDYMKQWLEDVKFSISESTYEEYYRQIHNRICPWFAAQGLRLCDLKAYHIDKFYKLKMKNDKVSAKTVLRYHANIRKALQRAVKLDMIPTNPADRVDLPKVKKFRGSYYTPEELQKLFECSKGTRFETVILLAGYLGVRQGEACGLRWKDVDFEKNTVSICGSLKAHDLYKDLYYGETKTEMSYRTLPMPEPVARYLKQLRKKQLERKMMGGESYHRKWDGYVCVDQMGDIINPKYISRYFADLLAKNNLRRIRFHDLRHSCATLLLENGATAQAGAGVAGPSQLCGNGGYLRPCTGRIEKNNGRNYVESFGKQQCGLTFQNFLTDDWQTSKTWKLKAPQKVMKKPCFHRKHGFRVAAEEGFEPSQTESESVVLPLHNSAIC